MDTHTSKLDIAMLYSPQHTPHAALKRLAHWMKACQPLMKALKKTGYIENSKKFSKRQITLIYNYLGEP